MDLNKLRDQLPDFARDIRLNLGSVTTVEGAPGLSEEQIAGVALASAIATGHARLIEGVEHASKGVLDDAHHTAARAAATIMAMNNVYYRFNHSVSNEEYSAMPARLRMNVIGNPGINKAEFELYSLAVSAINNCQYCVDAHERVVRKSGMAAESVHSAVRIAATINAAATALAANTESALAQAA